MEKKKYLINIYNIINERVSTDKLIIYKDIKLMLKKIESNEKDELNLFCYLKDMLDSNNRLNFLMEIEQLDIEEEKKRGIEIVNYMVLNNGEIKKIKNFDIVKNNIERISNIGIEEMRKSDLEKERNICEREIERNDDEIKKLCLIVRLVCMFNLMEEEIDNKGEVMEKDLENIVVKEREKEMEIIKNEFDLLNNMLRKKLGREELKNLEVLECKYNGVEIGHGELVEELMSHMFPEYLREKNIEDTLEDTYEIETNYVKIKREEGGNIMIKMNK